MCLWALLACLEHIGQRVRVIAIVRIRTCWLKLQLERIIGANPEKRLVLLRESPA